MIEKMIGSKKCFIYQSENASNCLIQPVDEHDLELLDKEVEAIRQLTDMPFILVAFQVEDWNRELSPWEAPAVFGKENFGTGAPETLSYITESLIPYIKNEYDGVTDFYLGGYSLAGLFSLWAGYQTDIFKGVAGVSPSVWFPEWDSFIRSNKMKASGTYLSLGDKEEKMRNKVMAAVGVVLLKGFKDYYYGYVDEKGKDKPGYVDMIEELFERFPLSEPAIVGEKNQRDFILLFGAVLRMRNLLSSFDDFAGKELISERDLQTYLGRYQDLRDEWKKKKDGDKEDITKDIVFEVELIKQIEINIDYILMLVKKYKDGNCEDKEIVVDIRRAVDASSELRSKKELIETFIANANEMDDVFDDWRAFVKEQKEKEINSIITEENLKAVETKKFVDNAFRDGELKTTGVGIDSLLPPMRRFGGNSNRAEKKQTVIEKLKAFFEKYFGIV